MAKNYTSAPLPFMGQKRMFVKEFRKVLSNYDNDVIVDLFGGSGLLSHVAKDVKPGAKVIYNDYDDYHIRIENIEKTNNLLRDIRTIVAGLPRHKGIPKNIKCKIIERIGKEQGFVDFITLSSSLLFSMKYVLNLEDMEKETLYTNIRTSDYNATGYLDGIDIVSKDYKDLYKDYKDEPNVLFLIDPPYLSTEVGTYRMNWSLSDYLDVLTVLKGKSFIYFTSNKSSIIELCDWIGSNKIDKNPFSDAHKSEFNQHMNYSSHYTDIMIYK
jgi:16S rRNA G966 N2-methylase RsmD